MVDETDYRCCAVRPRRDNARGAPSGEKKKKAKRNREEADWAQSRGVRRAVDTRQARQAGRAAWDGMPMWISIIRLPTVILHHGRWRCCAARLCRNGKLIEPYAHIA